MEKNNSATKKYIKYAITLLILLSPLLIVLINNNNTINKNWYTDELKYDNDGTNVKIALLDSGADSNEGKKKNFSSDVDNKGSKEHGTINYYLLSKINNEATIHNYKVTNEKDEVESDAVVKALKKAKEEGIKIIVMPFGKFTLNSELDSILKDLKENGAVIFSSVGDQNEKEILYPASNENVIPIGSLDKSKNSYEGNNGKESDYYLFPGVEIYATYNDKLEGKYVTGTSYATVLAAAFISQNYSSDSKVNYEDVIKILDEIKEGNYQDYIRALEK